MFPIEMISGSAAATRAIGEALAGWLETGDVLLLHGDLGAGKTTLVQGILQGLGHPGPAQSPTFTIAHEYEWVRQDELLRFVHLDLYRLAGDTDLDSFGFAGYLDDEDSIVVIEWPERAGATLPDCYWLMQFDAMDVDTRHLEITAHPDHAANRRRGQFLQSALAEWQQPLHGT